MTAPQNLSDKELKTALARSLGEAVWNDLDIHHQQGRLLFLESSLDIFEVGIALARDTREIVTTWLESESLRKPNESDIKSFLNNQKQVFLCMIVQPYVLAQIEQKSEHLN